MFENLSDQNKRAVFTSGLILIAANLLPIMAVLKQSWSFYDLLVLYWVEIIGIGLINVIGMILVNRYKPRLGFHLLKIAYVPFFVGHFGLFVVGIGLGQQVIFGKENFEVETQILEMLFGDLKMFFWPLVVSHIFSFFWVYVAQREYRRTGILQRMFAPYFRVIPLFLFNLAAAYVCLRLKVPFWGFIGLVLGKTLLDLFIHIYLHFRLLNYEEE